MTLFRIRVVVFSILLCWLKLIGFNLLLFSSHANEKPGTPRTWRNVNRGTKSFPLLFWWDSFKGLRFFKFHTLQ